MPKPLINLIYLKYFCDAIKHGTISASARENYVSQSAISQAIAQLEKILGTELIHHQSNRFKPTAEGMTVFEKAKLIFRSVVDLEESLQEEPGTIQGRLDFACMHSFALALLPKCLQKVKNRWPKLNVNFKLAHTDLIKDMIKKGSIDFGIVLDNEDLSSFECYEVFQGHYKLYVAKKYAENELPFILSEERIETNLLKASFKKHYKKDLPVLMEVSSWEVIANLTEEGLGIGFFPDYVAQRRKKVLQEFTCRYEPIPYKIYAIHAKGQKLRSNAEAFLELLKNS